MATKRKAAKRQEEGRQEKSERKKKVGKAGANVIRTPQKH